MMTALVSRSPAEPSARGSKQAPVADSESDTARRLGQPRGKFGIVQILHARLGPIFGAVRWRILGDIMAHIILLGDSIFDNGVYVPGGPDVVKQLRQVLPAGLVR
jgi:hypothetical protein